MNLEKNCALLVIDIQQEDFVEMNDTNADSPRWNCIRNARRILDVFRAKNLPIIQIKECHRIDMMEMKGASCTMCSDGVEIVEKFKTVKPGEYDAILMDIQMPKMNGLAAARAIRSGENPLGKTIPIIAMTANAFSEDVQKSYEAGMDAHLSKPVDMAALETALRKFKK